MNHINRTLLLGWILCSLIPSCLHGQDSGIPLRTNISAPYIGMESNSVEKIQAECNDACFKGLLKDLVMDSKSQLPPLSVTGWSDPFMGGLLSVTVRGETTDWNPFGKYHDLIEIYIELRGQGFSRVLATAAVIQSMKPNAAVRVGGDLGRIHAAFPSFPILWIHRYQDALPLGPLLGKGRFYCCRDTVISAFFCVSGKNVFRINVDSQELNPDLRKAFEDSFRETSMEYKAGPRPGPHEYWDAVRQILCRKFGIVWLSTDFLQPGTYD